MSHGFWQWGLPQGLYDPCLLPRGKKCTGHSKEGRSRFKAGCRTEASKRRTSWRCCPLENSEGNSSLGKSCSLETGERERQSRQRQIPSEKSGNKSVACAQEST